MQATVASLGRGGSPESPAPISGWLLLGETSVKFFAHFGIRLSFCCCQSLFFDPQNYLECPMQPKQPHWVWTGSMRQACSRPQGGWSCGPGQASEASGALVGSLLKTSVCYGSHGPRPWAGGLGEL